MMQKRRNVRSRAGGDPSYSLDEVNHSIALKSVFGDEFCETCFVSKHSLLLHPIETPQPPLNIPVQDLPEWILSNTQFCLFIFNKGFAKLANLIPQDGFCSLHSILANNGLDEDFLGNSFRYLSYSRMPKSYRQYATEVKNALLIEFEAVSGSEEKKRDSAAKLERLQHNEEAIVPFDSFLDSETILGLQLKGYSHPATIIWVRETTNIYCLEGSFVNSDCCRFFTLPQLCETFRKFSRTLILLDDHYTYGPQGEFNEGEKIAEMLEHCGKIILNKVI
jgi:hypothetical protein